MIATARNLTLHVLENIPGVVNVYFSERDDDVFVYYTFTHGLRKYYKN